MGFAKSYITAEDGSIQSVVIDFETYQRIEQILADQALAKAMDEAESDETISLEDAKVWLRFP